MALQTDLKEKGQRQLEKMQILMDELRVQMALGKAEAKDLFEKERKLLTEFINREKALLAKSVEKSEEHEQDIINKVIDLQNNLDQKLPDDNENFDEYKKEVLGSIYKLEFAIKTESNDVRGSLQKKLDDFKTKMDGYRLQLAMSNFENKDKLKDRKNELLDRINEMRDIVKSRQAEDIRMGNFYSEISESFSHFKKAFSDLLGN